MSDEVAVTVPDITVPEPWQGGTWDELTRDAHEVFGADLEKGAQLVGVPFCVVAVTFRPGLMNARTGELMFYASLDAIVAPDDIITRRLPRIPAENQEYARDMAGSHVVFNEGGTGVYRQIIAYLENQGRLTINSDLPREGRSGESRFDLSPREWHVDDTAELKLDDAGNPTLTFAVRLLCPRGLRSSEYENEYSKEATTRYFG